MLTTAIATIVVLGLLVFIHELGHFALAKFNGIHVYEFALGFGPKLVSFVRGGTIYTVRLLPLGGFVRMAGMDPDDEMVAHINGQQVPIPPSEGFNAKGVLQRFSVIAAGPIMNFVLAVVLIGVIFLFAGIPFVPNIIGKVLPDSPAAKAGLQSGDQVIEIAGQKITDWNDLVNVIQYRANKATEMVVVSPDTKEQRTVTITPEVNEQTKRGFIGVEQSQAEFKKANPFTALKYGAIYTYRVSVFILQTLAHMIVDQSAEGLGGPIKITSEVDKAVDMGMLAVVNLAAILSINLGLFNLLPIPALDGSRLLFLVLEGVRGKPIDPAKENSVHFVGFVLLMLLFVIVTFNDITQMVK